MDGTDHEYWLQGCEDERQEAARKARQQRQYEDWVAKGKPIYWYDWLAFLVFIFVLSSAGIWVVSILIELNK